MASTGAGRNQAVADMFPWDAQYTTPTVETIGTPGWVIAREWFWGIWPPTPTVIAFEWLSPPARFRQDPPVNVATVTLPGGDTARAIDRVSMTKYWEYGAEYTLDTAVRGDAASLAAYTVAEHADPRTRCPQLTFDLLPRSDAERVLLLSRTLGDRVTITGAPAQWPSGAFSLVIEGIRHEYGDGARTLVWNTAPVVGTVSDIPGPWFRWDESTWGGPDVIPF